MSINYVNKSDLTAEQNEALREFTASLAASFQYRHTVSFATLNNQLKFTSRMFANYNNQPRLHMLGDNKQTQSILSSLLINLQINNNRIAVNSSVKLAYLAALYAEDGKRFQEGTRQANAAIDASLALTSSQRNELKAAADSTFRSMFSAMFQAQVAATAKWANSKTSLAGSNASNKLYGLQSSLTASVFMGLAQTITESKQRSSSAVANASAGISAAFNGKVNSSTSSVMSNIMGSLALAGTYSGASDSEIDGEYSKSMSKLTLDANVSAGINSVLKSFVDNGALSNGESNALRSSVVSSFFAGIGINAKYVCEGGD